MGVKKSIKSSFTKSQKLCDLFSSFLLAKQSMNLAEDTLRGYKLYCPFPKSRGEDFLVSSVCEESVFRFIRVQQENGLKEVSINSYLRSIRTFFYWAMDKEYIKPFKITLLREQEVIVETYTREELKAILKSLLKR